MIPYITALTFEAQMNSEYDNDLLGDKYTIKLAVTDTEWYKDDELALYENVFNDTFVAEGYHWSEYQ